MYSHHGIFTDRYISGTILARKYIDQSGKPTDLKMLFLTLKEFPLVSFFFNLILLMRLYTEQSLYFSGKGALQVQGHTCTCM